MRSGWRMGFATRRRARRRRYCATFPNPLPDSARLVRFRLATPRIRHDRYPRLSRRRPDRGRRRHRPRRRLVRARGGAGRREPGRGQPARPRLARRRHDAALHRRGARRRPRAQRPRAIRADSGPLLTLDGSQGYGQVIGAEAMALGIERAKAARRLRRRPGPFAPPRPDRPLGRAVHRRAAWCRSTSSTCCRGRSSRRSAAAMRASAPTRSASASRARARSRSSSTSPPARSPRARPASPTTRASSSSRARSSTTAASRRRTRATP